VTEPVAGAPSVRRTVRVAVALLAGQALLCAVIGWLNFGPSPAHRGAARPVDPLAAPPFVAPAPSAGRVKTSAATPRPTRTSAKEKAPTTRPPRPTLPPPDPESPSIVDAPSPAASSLEPVQPAPPETTPELGTRPPPPSPSPSDKVQAPVKVSDDCAPEGALGKTSNGTNVRCVRKADGELRWEIV
jgi:hypothetical protein